MKVPKFIVPVLFASLALFSFGQGIEQDKNDSEPKEMIVRIAEVEIDSNYIDEFIAILKVEAEASLRLEPGVICIYPMYQKEYPTQIRLLEIYADKAAYKSHLQTPHFKNYKEAALKMVKDLKLIDMEAMDLESMPKIFNKLKQ